MISVLLCFRKQCVKLTIILILKHINQSKQIMTIFLGCYLKYLNKAIRLKQSAIQEKE